MLCKRKPINTDEPGHNVVSWRLWLCHVREDWSGVDGNVTQSNAAAFRGRIECQQQTPTQSKQLYRVPTRRTQWKKSKTYKFVNSTLFRFLLHNFYFNDALSCGTRQIMYYYCYTRKLEYVCVFNYAFQQSWPCRVNTINSNHL